MTVYEEGVRNLEQLEDILIRVDDGRGYKRWVVEHGTHNS